MNKEQLAAQLKNNHEKFIIQLKQLSQEDFTYAPEGKWSAAQQLDHIIKSVSPVNMALGLPKFLIRWKFGVANRPSKNYEALIEKYNVALQKGGKASGRFIPKMFNPVEKEKILSKLTAVVQKTADKTIRHTEEALDKYILPHPLLGKLTLREMLYFTAYHVQHHMALVEKGLEGKKHSGTDAGL